MKNKRSLVFFIIFFAAVLTSFLITFYQKGIKRDFEIYTDEAVFLEELEYYFEE